MSIILKIDVPRAAAEVRNPDRSECPLKSAAFSAARRAYVFTSSATALADSRRAAILPVLVTGRNKGPSVIAAALIQARTVSTGHAIERRAMAIVAPRPSWSVLLRRMVTRRPPSQYSRSATLRPTSSERRKASAKPSRRTARSRSPLRSVSAFATIARTLSAVAGALRLGALPVVRRMPRSVALTPSELVGGSWPASLWA